MACHSYKFGEVQRLDRPTVPGPHELPGLFIQIQVSYSRASGGAGERARGRACCPCSQGRSSSRIEHLRADFTDSNHTTDVTVCTRQAELSLYTRPMIFCFYLLVVFIETCSQGTTFQLHFRQNSLPPRSDDDQRLQSRIRVRDLRCIKPRIFN